MSAPRLRPLLLAGALLAGFFSAACNSGNSGGAAGTIHLTGAGSTFVYPIMTRWIAGFQQSHANVQINYLSIGSGGGILQVKNNVVDFGASDASLNDHQLKSMPPLIQIPESAGPVCITYNLPGLRQPLKLNAAVLSAIYLGKIKSWHDPAIHRLNAGLQLPNRPILVVHRSEGSGTTNIFTAYLSAVSPAWAKQVGKGIAVSWPVGLGGKGSEGVTGIVKQTVGAIGYVELDYASENHLPVARIENQAGKWLLPSAAGATAAIAAFTAQLATDVRSPIVNAPASAPAAYPISGFTFLLVPKNGPSRAKRQVLKQFIQYILSAGQTISRQLHFSPLPASVQQLDAKLLNQMQAAGQPLP